MDSNNVITGFGKNIHGIPGPYGLTITSDAFDVGSGPNRWAFVFTVSNASLTSDYDSQAVQSVTVGGISLTGHTYHHPYIDWSFRLWYGDVSSISGPGKVAVATFLNELSYQRSLRGIIVSSVNSSTPFNNYGFNTDTLDNAVNLTSTINTSAGELAVWLGYLNTERTFTPTAGTVRVSGPGLADGAAELILVKDGAGSSVTLGGTLSDLSYRDYVKFNILPAAAVPVLTSPTGTKTGAKTASGTVSTDTGTGTLYYYASTNASESVATIKASGASQAVSGTGQQNVTFSGLTSATTYYAHYAHNAAGGDSTAANSTPGFLTDPLFSNVQNSGAITTDAPAATGVTMSGPTTGVVGSPSTNFSIGVTPGGGAITGTLVVTPSSNGGGGVFTPTSLNLTTGSPTGTFTYTAGSAGTKTISVTNNGGLTDPGNISFDASAAPAATVTISGPNTGINGVASTNFTVGADGVITGTVVVTPSSGGGGGTFTPTSVSISSGAPTATFTYTPASVGAKSISVTNNGGLANPSSWTYTVGAAGGTATLNNWVKNTGSVHVNGELVNISFHNTSSRALIFSASNVAINSGADLVVTDVALVAGQTYAWIAESPTNSTWFASGRVTIS
jgi:hypothetical protein